MNPKSLLATILVLGGTIFLIAPVTVHSCVNFQGKAVNNGFFSKPGQNAELWDNGQKRCWATNEPCTGLCSSISLTCLSGYTASYNFIGHSVAYSYGTQAFNFNLNWNGAGDEWDTFWACEYGCVGTGPPGSAEACWVPTW